MPLHQYEDKRIIRKTRFSQDLSHKINPQPHETFAAKYWAFKQKCIDRSLANRISEIKEFYKNMELDFEKKVEKKRIKLQKKEDKRQAKEEKESEKSEAMIKNYEEQLKDQEKSKEKRLRNEKKQLEQKLHRDRQIQKLEKEHLEAKIRWENSQKNSRNKNPFDVKKTEQMQEKKSWLNSQIKNIS